MKISHKAIKRILENENPNFFSASGEDIDPTVYKQILLKVINTAKSDLNEILSIGEEPDWKFSSFSVQAPPNEKWLFVYINHKIQSLSLLQITPTTSLVEIFLSGKVPYKVLKQTTLEELQDFPEGDFALLYVDEAASLNEASGYFRRRRDRHIDTETTPLGFSEDIFKTTNPNLKKMHEFIDSVLHRADDFFIHLEDNDPYIKDSVDIVLDSPQFLDYCKKENLPSDRHHARLLVRVVQVYLKKVYNSKRPTRIQAQLPFEEDTSKSNQTKLQVVADSLRGVIDIFFPELKNDYLSALEKNDEHALKLIIRAIDNDVLQNAPRYDESTKELLSLVREYLQG